MSRISPRFAVWAILTFCGAAALVLAADGPRPVAASSPFSPAFDQQAQGPDAVAFRKPRVRECSKNRDCDDGNVCTEDKCDKRSGTCEFKPVHRRQACDDGNACTSVDVCDRGVCQGRNRRNGTVCSDGNACTQSDTCQSGACTGADPVTCSPSDQCHVTGACNPATGACSNPAAPDGTACADGNACTQTDSCQQGACSGSQSRRLLCQRPVPRRGHVRHRDGFLREPRGAGRHRVRRHRDVLRARRCEAGACTVPGALVEKIVFSTTRDNPVPPPGMLPQVNLEVYLMNPDGTGEVRLTNNSVNDSFAALSPDGKGRIVFDSARNSPPGSPPNLVDLFLMRSDGSNVQYLDSRQLCQLVTGQPEHRVPPLRVGHGTSDQSIPWCARGRQRHLRRPDLRSPRGAAADEHHEQRGNGRHGRQLESRRNEDPVHPLQRRRQSPDAHVGRGLLHPSGWHRSDATDLSTTSRNVLLHGPTTE